MGGCNLSYKLPLAFCKRFFPAIPTICAPKEWPTMLRLLKSSRYPFKCQKLSKFATVIPTSMVRFLFGKKIFKVVKQKILPTHAAIGYKMLLAPFPQSVTTTLKSPFSKKAFLTSSLKILSKLLNQP